MHPKPLLCLLAVSLWGSLSAYRAAGSISTLPGGVPEDDDKAATQQLSLPQPDEIPLPCQPDTHLPILAEAGLHVIPAHRPQTLYGIDVSHYQGKINWSAVPLDPNARFVYIKATESAGIVDEYYRKNLYEARKAGIPAGVYHFFSPSASAMMQLKNFFENVDPRQQDLVPIIDVERRGRGSSLDFHGKLSAVLRETEKYFGAKPIIYTGVNFYNEHLAGRYAGYKFMIARYGDEPPTLSDEVSVVLWQFTSSGYISGIQGKVDRSCFLGNYSLTDIMMPKTLRTDN